MNSTGDSAAGGWPCSRRRAGPRLLRGARAADRPFCARACGWLVQNGGGPVCRRGNTGDYGGARWL